MKKKATRKSYVAKGTCIHEDMSEDVFSRDDLRRARMEDDAFIEVLNKFLIWRSSYELVERRFDEVYDNLVDDVEYSPSDLVCGNPIYEANGINVGEVETVLSLKHMATLPGARLVEVQWGTFMLAP